LRADGLLATGRTTTKRWPGFIQWPAEQDGERDRRRRANTQYYRLGAGAKPRTRLWLRENCAQNSRRRSRSGARGSDGCAAHGGFVYFVADYYEAHPKPCNVRLGVGAADRLGGRTGDRCLTCQAADRDFSTAALSMCSPTYSREDLVRGRRSRVKTPYRRRRKRDERGPCRATCGRPRRRSLGGLRCQEFLLTGEPTPRHRNHACGSPLRRGGTSGRPGDDQYRHVRADHARCERLILLRPSAGGGCATGELPGPACVQRPGLPPLTAGNAFVGGLEAEGRSRTGNINCSTAHRNSRQILLHPGGGARRVRAPAARSRCGRGGWMLTDEGNFGPIAWAWLIACATRKGRGGASGAGAGRRVRGTALLSWRAGSRPYGRAGWGGGLQARFLWSELPGMRREPASGEAEQAAEVRPSVHKGRSVGWSPTDGTRHRRRARVRSRA